MEPRDLSAHVAYQAGRGVEEVARELGTVHAYPKAAATDLRERLAEEWGVTPAQMWLGNGADGALDYLARAMLRPGDHVLVPAPGFSYYEMSVRYHHGVVDEYPVHKSEEFAQGPGTVRSAYDGHRIVYLTSPHNPTGSEIPLSDVETIAEETDEETLVLVDEAYGEYTDRPSAVGLLADREDVAVLRTFSKAYGLAGARIGYAIVPEAWADAYARVNTPFAASELACRAGLAALDDRAHVER
ncbi:histidinol-phosphate aminotransferase, partial [Halobacteriales archaeon QS_9_70_65]